MRRYPSHVAYLTLNAVLLEPRKHTAPGVFRIALPIARPIVREERMSCIVINNKLRTARLLRPLRDQPFFFSGVSRGNSRSLPPVWPQPGPFQAARGVDRIRRLRRGRRPAPAPV